MLDQNASDVLRGSLEQEKQSKATAKTVHTL